MLSVSDGVLNLAHFGDDEKFQQPIKIPLVFGDKVTMKAQTEHTISVPKRQNPVSLHLVKLLYRALKFFVHFSQG